MGLITAIQKRFTRQPFLGSSISTIDGFGVNGEKPWPFNYTLAVEQCRSWVYRCAMGNATAAASVPLRLYVRKRSRAELKLLGYAGYKVFSTRSVQPRQKQYLHGESQHGTRPSGSVVNKIASFGDDFEEVQSHPIIDVLRNVNPWLNGFDLGVYRFLSAELTGNAYHFVVYDDALRRPVEMWPMLPHWVHAVPGDRDGDRLVDQYLYGADRLTEQFYDPAHVLHFRYPNPGNLYYGLGKVEAAWSALGMFYSERSMQKAMFDNRARPDWLLSVDGAQKSELDTLKKEVKGLLQGVRRAGQFLALGRRATATPLNFTADKLGSTEGIVEEVAGVFGYPITKLKANDPNRSNAETGDAGWLKDTILPMCRADEEMLNQSFVPMFADGDLVDDVVLAYDDPVPANRRMELAESRALTTAGLRTFDEDRALRGMSPLPDGLGDVPRVNGQRLDLLDEQMRQQTSPMPGLQLFNYGGELTKGYTDHGRDRKQGTVQEVDDRTDRSKRIDEHVADSDTATRSQHRSADRPPRKRGDDNQCQRADPDERSAGRDTKREGRAIDVLTCEHDGEDWPDETKAYRKAVEEVGDIDNDTVRDDEPEAPARRIALLMRDVFGQQLDFALSGIGQAKGKARSKRSLNSSDVERIDVALQQFPEEIRESLLEQIKRIFEAAGQTAYARIELDPTSFDVTSPEVLRAAERVTAQLITNINATTRARVQHAMRQTIDAGESITQAADRLREQFNQFQGHRATMIARTESATAFVEGERDAWRQSGIVRGKRWLLAPGACEFCRAIAKEYATKTVELDQPFLLRGAALRGDAGGTMNIVSDMQGAPLHPNCRCDLVPVIA